ncbi:hypothetical protein AAUPMB_17257, partial [Pasteurella multocida subsp. multocida str. Anand1_buffalo]
MHPSPQDVVLTDDQTFDDKQREVRISGKEDFFRCVMLNVLY